MFSLGDDIEVLAGRVVVHSHLNAPCTRCGSMDIHTLDECTERTRAIALAKDRAGHRGPDELPCGVVHPGYGWTCTGPAGHETNRARPETWHRDRSIGRSCSWTAS